MRTHFIALATLAVLVTPASGQDVPGEIVQLCKERWGADFEMQLFCQDRQMEALQELAARSSNDDLDRFAVQSSLNTAELLYKARGVDGLIGYSRVCHEEAEAPADQQGCQAVDLLGSFLTNDAYFLGDASAERNVATAHRVGAKFSGAVFGAIGGMASKKAAELR